MVTALAIAGIAAAVAIAGGGAAVAVVHIQKRQREERSFCQYCERACPGYDEPGDDEDPCPPGQRYDPVSTMCKPYPAPCPMGEIYDPVTKMCKPCPTGQVYDPATKMCKSTPAPGGGSYFSRAYTGKRRGKGRGGYGDDDDDDDDKGRKPKGGGYPHLPGHGVCRQCRARCRTPRPGPIFPVPPFDDDFPDRDYPGPQYDDSFYFDPRGIRHGERLGKQVGGFDYTPGMGIGMRPGGSGGIPTIGNVGSFGVLYRTPQSSRGLPIGGHNYPRYGAKGTFAQGNCMCDSVNCCYSQDVYHKSGLPQTVTRCEAINYGDAVQACEEAFYDFEESSFAGQRTYYAAQNLANARMARRMS